MSPSISLAKSYVRWLYHGVKYCYLRLPMGIKNSPDIFQKIIGDLTIDLPYVNAYIDDKQITSNGSFQDHFDKLNEVLRRLS